MRYASVLQQFTLRSGLLTAQYTMRRVRFGAILGEFLIEFFEIFPRPRNFGFEIAPKVAVPHVLQPGHDPQRSPNTVLSVGMPRHVRFGAILGEFLTEIFENYFRGREIFRSKSREIAPTFAPLSAPAVNRSPLFC